jgi:hypothetical protein
MYHRRYHETQDFNDFISLVIRCWPCQPAVQSGATYGTHTKCTCYNALREHTALQEFTWVELYPEAWLSFSCFVRKREISILYPPQPQEDRDHDRML